MVLLAIPPFANIEASFPNDFDLKVHDANAFSKGDRVQVSESVTVTVNGKPYYTQNISDDSKFGEFDKLNTIVVKGNTNSVTTMDKIFNAERLRFNGKALVRYDPMIESQTGKFSELGNSIAVLDVSDKKNSDLGGIISNVLSVLFSNPNLTPNMLGQKNMDNNNLKLVPDTNYEKYSVLLILVPISGSVIICSGNTRIKSKSFFSLTFMIILVTSAVTTPLSISGIYMKQASAEEENNNTLNASGFSNSTQLNLKNFSNSTQPLNFTGFSNATQTLDLHNFSNSTQPLNFSGFENATQTNTNSIITIPNATKSWTFTDNNNGTNSVGEVTIQNVENKSALSLQGNGYLTENLNSTRNLSHLTLSAWVKPDYSQGAPQFTIISAEKQFSLSVNNIVPPTKLATFSIFDGIKWNTINSTVPISGNWTHIAATFNGSSMQLYVNGTLRSSLELTNVLTIQVDGKIGTKTAGNITSNGNIVIGAYYDSVRKESLDQFSGLISNIDLYESTLDANQVYQIFSQELPSFYPRQSVAQDQHLVDGLLLNDEVTVSRITANSTILNDTAELNYTINPVVESRQANYLVTQSPQFVFQYYQNSTILHKTVNYAQKEITKLDKIDAVISNGTATNSTQNIHQKIIQIKQELASLVEQINGSDSTSKVELDSIMNNTMQIKQEVRSLIHDLGTKHVISHDSLGSIRTDETNYMVQDGQWISANETVSVQLEDPHGKPVGVKPVISQIADGRYTILVSPLRELTPGKYVIKMLLNKGGKTYLAQESYTWGLVSLNTDKSTYKPGQTANITIVVLDNGGHPVCNSDIAMQIQSPTDGISVLSTGAGIEQGTQCGLYHATYQTSSEGNYTVNVVARTPSGVTSFSTSFLVAQNYPFDITRTMDSKIDPINNPNLFNAQIDIVSNVNAGKIRFQEFVPSDIKVVTNANVQNSSGVQVLTWDLIPSSNKTSVKYSYSVPLEFPKLYVFGPAKITYGNNQSFTESRPWFVANDPATTITDTIQPSEKVSTGQEPKDSISFSITTSTGSSVKDTVAISDNPTVTTSTFNSVSVQDSLASQLSDKVENGNMIQDTVSVTDSPSTSESVFNSVSVQDSLASQLSDKVENGNMIQDTISMTDSPKSVASLSLPLSESLAVGDAATISHQALKPLSESLAVGDAATISHQALKPLSESLAVGNAATISHQALKPLSESLAVGNAATISHQALKPLSENVSILDSSTSAVDLAPTQDLIENNQKQVTVTSSQPQLVVVNSNAKLSNITIPVNVTTSSINYSAIVTSSGNNNSVQILSPLNITKYSKDNSPLVSVTIPAGTLSGTSWNGVFDLPTIQSGQNLVVVPTSLGQSSTVNIVIEIGSSIPLKFDNAVRIVLVGQAGQHVGYFYTPTVVTEITTTCTDDTQTTNNNLPAGGNCKISNDGNGNLIVWTKHFTGFATWSSATSARSSPSSVGTSNGAGAGSVSTGPSVGASSTEGEFGGILLPQLEIDQVSYDVCDKNMARIIVGTDSDEVPSVILRSSISGVVSAQLAQEQPFLNDNLNATIKKYVYDVAINPQEKSFEVVALLAENNNVNSAGKTIDVTTCKATVTFEQYGPEVRQQATDLSAPMIFDTKFQIANGTKQDSSDPEGQYVDNQPLTIHSIISSPTPITKVELRYVQMGQDLTKYASVSMNVVPLQISNTTYAISGTIPQEMMQAPAINYWIDVQNEAGKTSDSTAYTIGVKPAGQPKISLELDTRYAKAEGSMRTPQAYIANNGTSTVYGFVELIVDGKPVFKSLPETFAPGQTQVNLQWKVPTTGIAAQHTIQTRAEIYGQTFETQVMPIFAYPRTVVIPLSKLDTISSMMIGNSTIADAHVIHSSFKHGMGMRYNVIASDGTCVIGSDKTCLVTNSTNYDKMGFKTITLGDQQYQVRYSGPDSPLERFSITSVDPIVGQWKVGMESNDHSGQTQLENTVLLQIKYQSHDPSVITINPKS